VDPLRRYGGRGYSTVPDFVPMLPNRGYRRPDRNHAARQSGAVLHFERKGERLMPRLHVNRHSAIAGALGILVALAA
jgi:hypothetical protein